LLRLPVKGFVFSFYERLSCCKNIAYIPKLKRLAQIRFLKKCYT
jgi:hypothetical protein